MKLYFLIFINFSFLFLVGCAKNSTSDLSKSNIDMSIVKLSSSGQKQKIIDLVQEDQSILHNASLATTQFICSAYLDVQNFNDFFSCIDLMESKYNKGDTKISGGTDGMTSIVYLKSKAYLQMNLPKKVLEMMEVFDIEYHKKTLYDAYGSFMSKEETDNEAEAMFLPIYIETYSKLGLLDKARIEIKKHIKYIEFLERKYTVTNNSVPGVINSNTIAHEYMMIGDYSELYNFLNSRYPDRNFNNNGIGNNDFKAISSQLTFYWAKALYETNKQEQAKYYYSLLLDNHLLISQGNMQWIALNDLGKIQLSKGDLLNAINHFSQAIELIELRRSSINTEENKIGFVYDKQDVYANLINCLFQSKQYAKAFEYSERAKSRALVDMLASKQNIAPKTLNALEFKTMLAKLKESNKTLLTYNGTPKEYKSHQRGLKKIQNKIHQKDSEFASMISVETVNALDMQALLSNDETIIEYFIHKDNFFAFIVTPDSIKAVKLNSTNLTKNIKIFREALTTQSNMTNDYAYKLYYTLINPLIKYLKTQNITIIPHGVLHYVPFNALTDKRNYMIERYSLRILPSATVMRYLNNRKIKTPTKLLALGNPDLYNDELNLAGAEIEVKTIVKQLPNSQALYRSQATETNFKELSKGFNRFHFAVHGVFDEKQPLQSGLLLSKDDINDGVLTADELYSMKLNADLVTLSACETGLGEINQGDDVIGLTRGFLYAGAQSIVASLWKVDDMATAYLMKQFYSNLQSQNKREALRQAQIKTMKQFPQPYFWSSFQIIGSD